ncbi:MAG: mercury transporter MerT [Betaproteobacteria bacterium]|nr:mercury transporter MerT [Betaproteobacteria bacterium]
MNRPAPESVSIAAGALSALGASTCCVLPLALVSIGIGGAWVAQLRELERFQWIFIALAIAAFGFAFYRLYVRPAAACAPGTTCAPATRRRQRIAFWVTLLSAKALVLSPFYVPYLLG